MLGNDVEGRDDRLGDDRTAAAGDQAAQFAVGDLRFRQQKVSHLLVRHDVADARHHLHRVDPEALVEAAEALPLHDLAEGVERAAVICVLFLNLKK